MSCGWNGGFSGTIRDSGKRRFLLSGGRFRQALGTGELRLQKAGETKVEPSLRLPEEEAFCGKLDRI
jgi:hypothetical protein